MKNAILLIFTEADLAALPQAVESLKSMGLEFLWVMHNPHLGLPYPETAKGLDDEIALAERSKASAIAREDFEKAGEYRNTVNDLRVKRDLEIKNSYRPLPQEHLQRAYDGVFGAISQESTGIPNIMREAIADPLSPEQVFQYLHSQTQQWVDQMPHGEYAIFWVRSLPSPITRPAPIAALASTQEQPAPATAPIAREGMQEMKFFAIRKLAAETGVVAWADSAKMKKPELIEALLAKSGALAQV